MASKRICSITCFQLKAGFLCYKTLQEFHSMNEDLSNNRSNRLIFLKIRIDFQFAFTYDNKHNNTRNKTLHQKEDVHCEKNRSDYTPRTVSPPPQKA